MSTGHSIIRTGLRSGFVPGIYMAQEATTSYGYMGVNSDKEVKGTEYINHIVISKDGQIQCGKEPVRSVVFR